MNRKFSSVQSLSSVWLCDPIDWSMPRFPVHHCNSRSLLKLIQSSWWCDPTISSSVVPFSSCLQSFPASGSFPMSQSFTSDDQSIGVSASASVLPMNIQDWFTLGWTGWISLQSKGLSSLLQHQICFSKANKIREVGWDQLTNDPVCYAKVFLWQKSSRLTDIENKLVVASGDRGVGGVQYRLRGVRGINY